MNRKFYFVVSGIPKELLAAIKSPQGMRALEREAFSKYSHWWGSQEWVWIVQTFLYLRQAGLNVELVDHPIDNEICVTHFVTTKNKIWGSNSFVVGIRSDTPPMRMKEFEIVQSPAVLKNKNASFVCLWPQNNLSFRDASRGNRVETMSYFGGSGGLAPAFQDADFKTALERIGISLNLCVEPNSWGNYSHTDLVIAVRNHHHPLLIETKPASKLINSWQAGCVALLGKEPAYREVGLSGENYFEVETPQAVLSIAAELKENPKLYQKIREDGQCKYEQYSFEAITQQWIALLTGPVSEAFDDWQNHTPQRKRIRYPLRCWQSTRQWIDHKLFSLPVRAQAFIANVS